MDLSDVEQATFHALGGADKIVINDVSGTDLIGSGVVVDLEGVAVFVWAMASWRWRRPTARLVSSITATSFNGFIGVVGTLLLRRPSSMPRIFDQLVINGNAGNDVIDASALVAGQISLTLNGGLGADGAKGQSGRRTPSTAVTATTLPLLGAGDVHVRLEPGDDNDTIEGQAGA